MTNFLHVVFLQACNQHLHLTYMSYSRANKQSSQEVYFKTNLRNCRIQRFLSEAELLRPLLNSPLPIPSSAARPPPGNHYSPTKTLTNRCSPPTHPSHADREKWFTYIQSLVNHTGPVQQGRQGQGTFMVTASALSSRLFHMFNAAECISLKYR